MSATTDAPVVRAAFNVSTTHRSYRRMSIATMVGGAAVNANDAHHVDRVAVEQHDPGPQLPEVDDELERDAPRRRTRQHHDGVRLVGEALDHDAGRFGVDLIERRRHVRLFDVRVQPHIVEAATMALLADPLGRRSELAAQVALDGVLQPDIPVVAELVRQPHDGRRAGAGSMRQIGDRAEPDDLGCIEEHLRDPAFSRSELITAFADPVGDAHRRPTLVDRLILFQADGIVERTFQTPPAHMATEPNDAGALP